MHTAAATRIQSLVGEGGLENEVLRYVKEDGKTTDYGASITNFVALYREIVPEVDIRQAFHNLASRGYIYSTVDENHYKWAMESTDGR